MVYPVQTLYKYGNIKNIDRTNIEFNRHMNVIICDDETEHTSLYKILLSQIGYDKIKCGIGMDEHTHLCDVVRTNEWVGEQRFINDIQKFTPRVKLNQNLKFMSEEEIKIANIISSITSQVSNPYWSNDMEVIMDNVDIFFTSQLRLKFAMTLIRTFPQCRFILITEQLELARNVLPKNIFRLKKVDNVIKLLKSD